MQKKTIWKNKEQMKQIGKKSNKMTDLSSLSIITINANSLNTPNKSKRLSNWIKKKMRTQLYATYKNPTIKIRIGLKLKNKKNMSCQH